MLDVADTEPVKFDQTRKGDQPAKIASFPFGAQHPEAKGRDAFLETDHFKAIFHEIAKQGRRALASSNKGKYRCLHDVPSGPNPISNDLPRRADKTLGSPPAAKKRH